MPPRSSSCSSGKLDVYSRLANRQGCHEDRQTPLPWSLREFASITSLAILSSCMSTGKLIRVHDDVADTMIAWHPSSSTHLRTGKWSSARISLQTRRTRRCRISSCSFVLLCDATVSATCLARKWLVPQKLDGSRNVHWNSPDVCLCRKILKTLFPLETMAYSSPLVDTNHALHFHANHRRYAPKQVFTVSDLLDFFGWYRVQPQLSQTSAICAPTRLRDQQCLRSRGIASSAAHPSTNTVASRRQVTCLI